MEIILYFYFQEASYFCAVFKGDNVLEKGDLISDEEIDDYFNKVGLAGDSGEDYDLDGEEGDDEEDWDKEATQLYQWTQELSFHDDAVQTPMMAT